MRILITGSTGFIGQTLCPALMEQGHELTLLVRDRQKAQRLFGTHVSLFSGLSEWTPDIHFDSVINLAGEPIMGRRWTAATKQSLWNSRVTLTQELVNCMKNAQSKPASFISGSAVGLYGDQGDKILDETSAANPAGFGHELCAAWEDAAMQAERQGVRVCLIRTGLVVGKGGGFLKNMLLPFRLGLGAKIGDGQQWMPWIHITDHLALMQYLLNTPAARGPFNLTAPHPVTNAEFTQTLANALKRPAVLWVPAWLLKLAAGEMAELLLGSQRALPLKAQSSGYSFSYPTLDSALQNVLNS